MDSGVLAEAQTSCLFQRSLEINAILPQVCRSKKNIQQSHTIIGKGKELSWGIVLGVLIIALRDSTKGFKTFFAMAMKLVHLFIDLHFMAQCTTQTIEAENYMYIYLKDLHNYRNIILEFQAYKRTKLTVKNRKKSLQV